MKRYTLSGADSSTHKPQYPERTAHKQAYGSSGLNFDIIYQIWPNRASMAMTIRMQERGENFAQAWRACVPLTPGEGN